MGVVYEAQQDEPRRRVAIKMIRRDRVGGRWRDRFKDEVEALGRLKHPGIAHIYEADGEGDCPFFVMELIDGEPLDVYARAHKLHVKEKLRLVEGICDALQYAHRSGVIHLDLKPTNILVSADRQSRILDFGIAQLVSLESPPSQAAASARPWAGTVAYMSPEQARGDSVDERSDIYSLGVICFELLTGCIPRSVQSASINSASRRQGEQPTAAHPQGARRFRKDLESIVAVALSADPENRYRSAAEFAEDLRRYGRNEPITVRPERFQDRVHKFALRNKYSVIIVTVLSLGIALSSWLALRASASERNAIQQAYREAVTSAAASIHNNDGLGAMRSLERAKGLSPSQLGWEWHYLRSRAEESEWQSDRGGGGQEDVAFSPCGAFLAASNNRGGLRIWSAKDRSLLKTLAPHALRVSRIAFSPSAPVLACASEDGTVSLFHATDFTSIRGHLEEPSGYVYAMAFSPDGSKLAAGDEAGTLVVWDTATWKPLWSKQQPEAGLIWTLAFSPDGSQLASSAWADPPPNARRCEVNIRSAATGELVATLRDGAHALDVNALLFTPNHPFMVTGSDDRTIRVWNTDTWQLARPAMSGFGGSVQCMAVSRNGSHLAVASTDTTARLWTLHDDIAQWHETGIAVGHTLRIIDMVFTHDETRLVTCSEDKTVRIWDSQKGMPIARLLGHDRIIRAVAVSDDDRLIASCGDDNTTRIWSSGASRDLIRLDDHGSELNSCLFSPDLRFVATASADGTLRLFDLLQDGAPTARVERLASTLTWLRFSADGKQIACGGRQGDDPSTGSTCIVQLDPAKLAFTGDGRFFERFGAVSSDLSRCAITQLDGRIDVLETRSGERLLHLDTQAVTGCPALSRFGDLVGYAATDGPVRFVSVADGKVRCELPSAEGPGPLILFSDDGEQALLVWARSGLQLVDLVARQSLEPLREAGVVLYGS